MVQAIEAVEGATRQGKNHSLGEDEGSLPCIWDTQTLYQRLHSLKQGAQSVDDYTEEFYHLIAWNNLSEIEE